MLKLRRPRICPRPGGLSGVLNRGTPHGQGICICPAQWTNVVHRDGRRSRPWHADVAQLVAHHLAKVRVAGSNPVIRSRMQWHQPQRWSGRVVRQRPAKPCTRVRFPSPPPKFVPARLAQRESASLTRKRSLVQSQYRAPAFYQVRPGNSGPFVFLCRMRAALRWLVHPLRHRNDPQARRQASRSGNPGPLNRERT